MRVDEIKTHFFRRSLRYCCFAAFSICFRNVERWAIIHLFFLVLVFLLIDQFCHSYITFILIFETFVIFFVHPSLLFCFWECCNHHMNESSSYFAKRSCLTMRNGWEVKRGAMTISRKYSHVRIDVQQSAQPSNVQWDTQKFCESYQENLIWSNLILLYFSKHKNFSHPNPFDALHRYIDDEWADNCHSRPRWMLNSIRFFGISNVWHTALCWIKCYFLVSLSLFSRQCCHKPQRRISLCVPLCAIKHWSSSFIQSALVHFNWQYNDVK